MCAGWIKQWIHVSVAPWPRREVLNGIAKSYYGAHASPTVGGLPGIPHQRLLLFLDGRSGDQVPIRTLTAPQRGSYETLKLRKLSEGPGYRFSSKVRSTQTKLKVWQAHKDPRSPILSWHAIRAPQGKPQHLNYFESYNTTRRSLRWLIIPSWEPDLDLIWSRADQ